MFGRKLIVMSAVTICCAGIQGFAAPDPCRIGDGLDNVYNPRLSVNSGGDAAVVWIQRDESGSFDLYTRRYSAVSGWQPLETMNTTASPNGRTLPSMTSAASSSSGRPMHYPTEITLSPDIMRLRQAGPRRRS